MSAFIRTPQNITQHQEIVQGGASCGSPAQTDIIPDDNAIQAPLVKTST
jgi:hypothetical protein